MVVEFLGDIAMKKISLLILTALSLGAVSAGNPRQRSASMVEPSLSAQEVLSRLDKATDTGVRKSHAFVKKADGHTQEAFMKVRKGLGEVDTVLKEAPARLNRVKREVESASRVAHERKEELDALRKQSVELGQRIHRTFEPYGVSKSDYVTAAGAIGLGGGLAYRQFLAQQAHKDRMRRTITALRDRLRGKKG